MLPRRYLERVPVAQLLAGARRSGLQRRLGSTDLVLLGIGAMIGAGIFTAVGRGAALAGPAVGLSYAIAGFGCLLAAFAYAELSAALPTSGSSYAYVHATMGVLMGWIAAWNLAASYIIGNVAVAIAWSDNLEAGLSLLGINLPAALTAAPGTAPGAVLDLPAFLVMAAVTGVVAIGIQQSKIVNAVLTLFKLGALALFLALGAARLQPELVTGDYLPMGWAGVARAAGVVLFAFIGFEVVSATAEETRRPQRDLPLGILGALVLVTLVYIAVSTVLVGLVPWDAAGEGAALARGFQAAGYGLRVGGIDLLTLLVATGAVAATTSVILVFQIGVARVTAHLAQEGFLPSWIGHVDAKTRTPLRATVVTGLATAMLAAVVPFGDALDLTNFAALALYILVLLSVPLLRRIAPQLARPFRTPFMPVTVAVGTIVLLGLIAFLGPRVALMWLGWMGLGLLLYGLHPPRRR